MIMYIFIPPPPQIDAFRQLSRLSEEPLDDQELPLVDNFRPVQPVGDRTVYSGYILCKY